MRASAPNLSDRTVTTALLRATERAPDETFLRTGESSRSFAQVNSAACAIAQGLARLDLRRYGKAALMLRNSHEFVESWFGVSKLGAVYVPINTDYKGDILEYQLSKADVTHIIVEADLLPRLAEIQGALPQLRAVVPVVRDSAAGFEPFDPQIVVMSYAELLDTPGTEPDVRVSYTDPHAISFTSGTTGPSKGVLATHCHTLTFALDWMEACGFRTSDRLYGCLPMFHAIATWLGVLPCLLHQTTYAFSERFSATRFWHDVRRYEATVIHGIFSMIPILLKQPPAPDDQTVPARLFYIGQRNPEFERRFNCRIVEVYGSTETGIVTRTPLEEAGVTGSCGRANEQTYEVELVDEHDEPVPTGAVGEIVVRPRQPFSMLSEYYGMPQETLQAFRNLWFHTGDTARRDASGYFCFADRKKDAIRRRGENISSFELERALISDSRILECAAVAVPSELGEDDVKIVIVAQAGHALSAEDVWKLCEQRMPRFWMPRFLEFRESLPKTPNGKIQKYLLRDVSTGTVIDRERVATTAPRQAATP